MNRRQAVNNGGEGDLDMSGADGAAMPENKRERPKLLIAATIPATISAFLIPYADHFRGLGWRVDAMARGAAKSEPLEGHFDSLIDAEWSRNPLDLNNIAKNNRRIRELSAARGYDIVHVHTPVASFVTRLALRKLRLSGRPKVVYTAHGFHFCRGGRRASNFIFRTLEKMAGHWTDKLIVINREDFEAAKKYRVADPESLTYMPGIGLDFSAYGRREKKNSDTLKIRAELGLGDDDILYSMIAEFNPGKRHKDAIIALSKTGEDKIHLACAGDGRLLLETKDLAQSLGVEKRVHFLGRIADPRPLLEASRATIMPSEREGLSRALMESACLGVPIIGSDARGVYDIVHDHRGLLFPVGDQLALRDAMLQMAAERYPSITPDPNWRIENLIHMHEELYEELLKNMAGDGER
ncbi:MAG: glycosyltransferase [Synergistaceae bacterium]|jgi:glycosyltransferase involved in cell wall biosynthesis|nr:glycosyltransferase [Synergistaceae bacterium]